MPRKLKSAFKTEILRTTVHPQILIEMTLDDSPTYLRYAIGTKDITWGGVTWTQFPANVDSFTENLGSETPEMNVTFSAIDRTVITNLDSYDYLRNKKVSIIMMFMNEDADTGIWQPIAKVDDEGEKNFLEIILYVYLTSVNEADNSWIVSITLRPKFNVEGAKIPGRAFHRNYCQWVYRGEGCGYTGDNVTGPNSEADYCNHTLDTDYGCLALTTSTHIRQNDSPAVTEPTDPQHKRYGGFPDIESPREFHLWAA